jgi:hypothetical protein
MTPAGLQKRSVNSGSGQEFFMLKRWTTLHFHFPFFCGASLNTSPQVQLQVELPAIP